MTSLFEFAFARLDRARSRREEFADVWGDYIAGHPWWVELEEVAERTVEMIVKVREPAPAALSLAFSDWLAALRAALDNGLYAWAAAATGQNPPPDAGKLQFPIATTQAEFRNQAKRLSRLPSDIVVSLEKAQPYQSPFGPETNLLYWVHELARIDRHRTLHIGLGRIAEHRVRVGLPDGITAEFDETVQPYDFIDGQLVIARFTLSRPVPVSRISFNPMVGIDPEIKEWARFRLGGRRKSLEDRMVMTELYMRNHLENMALYSGAVPPGGFRTFDPQSSPSN